ncbi:unnamed protein product [Bursaphelenchus okinawaensis]|uniref:F-box domain-containing protein n=1 Tax=Bursaphelenchus okinawaensis TaxID=465554 RepID=A0A811JVZ2_9BILA|nr:unnamed protein product [Bursaphelenchus okinawaensis]CAG9085104.1 unnamed protein product [Bursaphelenchus okinawaensis]
MSRLSIDVWRLVLEYVESMEALCSLALVNKSFYKLINIDFRKVCIENTVFRLENECWAEAFFLAPRRLFTIPDFEPYCDEYGGRYTELSFINEKHSVSCPYSGKMAFVVLDRLVLITNIDLGLNEFKLVDFREGFYQICTKCATSNPHNFNVDDKIINKVQLINRGTQLIVVKQILGKYDHKVLIYDFKLDQVIREYSGSEDSGILIYDTKKEKTVLEKDSKEKWSIFTLFENIYNESTGEILRYNKKSSNWKNVGKCPYKFPAYENYQLSYQKRPPPHSQNLNYVRYTEREIRLAYFDWNTKRNFTKLFGKFEKTDPMSDIYSIGKVSSLSSDSERMAFKDIEQHVYKEFKENLVQLYDIESQYKAKIKRKADSSP